VLSELCRSCGLCCDGSLFGHVRLSSDEVLRLKALQIPTVKKADGTLRLQQCCTALKGRQCGIYFSRPEACRKYVCELGEAVTEEEIPLEEAMEIVLEGHRLIRKLELALPDAKASSPASPLQRAREGQDGPISDEAHACWLKAEGHLRLHFLGHKPEEP
jgi:Fe-S-cluster containining protein